MRKTFIPSVKFHLMNVKSAMLKKITKQKFKLRIKRCKQCNKFGNLQLELKKQPKLLQPIKKDIADAFNHSQHPKLKRCTNEINSFNKKLIPELLHEPLMKVANKLLSRDQTTYL